MGGSVRIAEAALTQEFFLASTLGLCKVSDADVKFGYGTGIADGVLSTVWAGTGIAAPFTPQPRYVFPVSGGQPVEAVSGNVGDTQDVKISGLDASGLPQVETVTLTGTVPVAIPGTWTAVNRAFNVGSTELAGEVVVRGTGAPNANIFAVILPDDNQTVQTPYVVPSDKVAVVVNYSTAINKSGTQDASAAMRLIAKRPGGVFRTAIRYGLQRNGVSNISSDLVIPGVFPPSTQIEVTTEVSAVTGTTDISAEFSFILINKDTFTQEFLDSL